MPQPFFFNRPTNSDRLQVTPFFTTEYNVFSTKEDETSRSFSECSRTPAPVLFSYSRYGELDNLPLRRFEYTNNGIFTPFSNFNEFGNRAANILSLPIAGLQLLAYNALKMIEVMLGLAQDIVALDIGRIFGDVMRIVRRGVTLITDLMYTLALTAWELMATTVRIIPTISSLFTSPRAQEEAQGDMVKEEAYGDTATAHQAHLGASSYV